MCLIVYEHLLRQIHEFLQIAIGHIAIFRLVPDILPPEVLVFANCDELLDDLQLTPEDVSIVFRRENRSGVDIWEQSLSAFSIFGCSEGVSRCLSEIYQRQLCLLELALKTTRLAEAARNGNSQDVRELLEENVDPNSMCGATVDMVKNICGKTDDAVAISIRLLCFERG